VSGQPATLDDLRSFVIAQTRKIERAFKRPDDDWSQVLLVQTPSGVDVVQVPMLKTGREKEQLAETLKQAVGMLGAYRYALLMNMHYRMVDVANNMDEALDVLADVQAERVRVQDMPDAIEALMLMVGDAESEQLWLCEIDRHTHRPPKLKRWERWDDREGAGYSGRFFGLNEYMRVPR
jgi:hypothetical protein